MTDIATVIVLDQATGTLSIDWAMNGPDLASEDGLQGALLRSLFTDRLANPDDVLPDTFDGAVVPDRRGCWRDTPPDGSAPKPFGSWLWLLVGRSPSPANARLAALYVRKAVQWLIDRGAATRIDVKTVWQAADALSISLVVYRSGVSPQSAPLEFEFVWSPTIGLADTPPDVLPPYLPLEAAVGASLLISTDGPTLDVIDANH